MEKRSTLLVAIGFAFACSLLLSESALAHHGTAAYDATRTLTLRATVTEFEWANPHCELRFDVKDGRGNVQHWTVEAINPLMLGRYGWTRTSLKPGDIVTVTFRPAKNGEMIGILEKVVLADGRELPGRQLEN